MAVDPHGTSVTAKDGGASSSMAFITEHKTIFMVVGAGIAIIVVIYLVKRSSGTTTTAPAGNAANNTAATGAQDANTATALNDLQSQFNALQQAIADAAAAKTCPTGQTMVAGVCVTVPPIVPKPKPITPVHLATIRARGSLKAASAYDKKQPKGIPLHSSPGGTVTGYLAYGSSIPIIGAMASGPNNLGVGNKSGSTQWDHVQGGWISLEDVSKAT